MKQACKGVFGVLVVVCMFGVAAVHAQSNRFRPFDGGLATQWTEIDPAVVYPEFEYKDLTPACSNLPGTSDTFTFFAKGGQRNNLVIFLQGGGACWNTMNCIYLPTYVPESGETTAILDAMGGIFDTANPSNPFRKWGFVWVPNCTGDLFWGANDQAYPVNPADFQGQGEITIQHRGHVNFQVALQWIQDHTRNPKRILVAGASAGSYGATLAFAHIKEAFPHSRLYLLADAGNGVVTEDFTTEGIQVWSPQMPESIYPDGYIPGTTITDVMVALANEYPKDRLAQYTTAWDATQVSFYSMMLNIDDPRQWEPFDADGNIIPGIWLDWHLQMIASVHQTAAVADNYRFYVGAGTDHTILRSDKFYTESALDIPFSQWVRAMVYQPNRYRWGQKWGLWRNVESSLWESSAVAP